MQTVGHQLYPADGGQRQRHVEERLTNRHG
jgi:hypothetical protein